MSLEYLPLAIESIDPTAFPAVALYTRQEGTYVLHREKSMPLTGNGLINLREGDVEFVFVPATDAEYVRSYYESNLGRIFAGKKLSRMGKNLVLCSVMVNYIIDVYQQPDQPWMYQKCRALLNHFQLQITGRDELLELLSKVSSSEVYLFTHSAQVAILSMYMHKTLLNSSPSELAEVGLGSMLLDIGMMHVSSNIVDKAGALSNDEYFRVKHHTRDGHLMAHAMGITEQVALTIILRHHERYDGRGYPGHLYGNNIPLCAQIAAICDVYSALTNDRPFRPASTPERALETMRGERKLFHPEIFTEFEAFMAP